MSYNDRLTRCRRGDRMRAEEAKGAVDGPDYEAVATGARPSEPRAHGAAAGPPGALVNQKLQAAFEHALDAILITEGSVLTDANPAACALVGLPRERIVGRSFQEFHRPRDGQEVERLFATMLAEGAVRGDIDVIRGDGTIRRVEFSATANILPGVHLSLLRDVTERRQRELMSQRYALLSRHARDVVLFLDEGGTIVEANDAAVAAYGYDRGELVGLDVRALRTEETRELVRGQMDEAFERGILFETVHRRKDGSTFPIEVSSRAARIGCDRMLLTIGRDLSERAEMQANLLHADRLAAVGTLAAGVAHEINNPLAYTMGNLDMLARRLPEATARLRAMVAADAEGEGPPAALGLAGAAGLAADLDEAESMLVVAREGAARVRSIVLDLLRFSRPDEALVGTVDVHEVLEYAISIATPEVRHRARLVRAYGPTPFVAVNESRLGQVFLNLLINAAQAIPEGHSEEQTLRIGTHTDDEGRVVIEVSDTGEGIPAHLLRRVFDPFFTTKPVGEGTGLGLFVSRSIVKTAGGDIAIESDVGCGTTVRVTLPSAPAGQR
jgi:PAS domain S-box-containing protein